MIKVHYKQIPHEIHPFLDDYDIKRLKNRYDDVEISFEVCRFVYEYAQIFERFMRDVWIVELMISEVKSIIEIPGIMIVETIYDYDECHPE